MNKLIVFSGLPGTGKSTISELLAKDLQCPIFSVDPIESAIISSGIVKSFNTGLAAYNVAEILASEHLKLKQTVIIDAVNSVREAREMWDRLSVKFNVKKIIIECNTSEDIHKKRIESRKRNLPGFPELTWEDVQQMKKEYLSWNEDHLVLDTSLDNESNLKRIRDYLKKK